ncbi:chlamydia polymorphic membrane middle domain protein, partial [Chlamydia ibidis]
GGGGGTSTSANIKTLNSTQKAIAIDSLSLIDADGNGYEYPVFGKNLDITGITAAITGSGGSVSAPTTNNTDQLPHYGYQGSWAIQWGSAAQTNSAKFIWTHTGY